VHEKITRYLPQTLDTIQIIDTIYRIKNLPSFIENNGVRKIARKYIKDIYLIEWTDITGACEMPKLKHESVQKLISCNSFISKLKSFNVHDEVYIYTDSVLDVNDFNFLIDNSYNYSEPEPSIMQYLTLNGVKIQENKNIYPSRTDLNLAFEYHYGQIDAKLNSINDVNISNEINEYFGLLREHFSKKKSYYSLIQEYLISGKTRQLIDFLNSNDIYPYERTELTNKINGTENNETDRLKTVILLMKKDYIIKIDPNLEVSFNKIVDDYNIIVLSVSWD